MAGLELRGVSKSFGHVEACRDVNLTVADGEFVTLLGPSGCGKSTTLNLVAGLETPTVGEIVIDGRVVNGLSPYERDVAMVFQNYALYPHMTVEQNISFSLRLRGKKRPVWQERVLGVARILQIEDLLDRLPRELSGGQQQRVALGRAMIREPRLFLFDEPFSNLDATLRLRMRGEIKELHQRIGVTSLFVTHDQEEAMSISDRIVVMREGRVVQVGTPDAVYVAPVDTYVAKFIGSPQMDILQGEFSVEDGRYTYVVGGVSFAVPSELVPRHEGPMDLGVRAEFVRIGDNGDTVPVTITQPLGPVTYVTLSRDGCSITSRVPGIALYKTGDQVTVSLDPAGILFFDRATGDRLAAGS